MKTLGALLLVLFILGIATIVIPIMFPSSCFKVMQAFLDWKERESDWDEF